MKVNPHLRNREVLPKAGERGYVLLVLLLMAALLLIGLTAAAPAIGTVIKRDREEELIHRGKQYVRAIKLFYRKFGRYPTSLKELEDTNHMRFLRKEYKDPMTPSGKWRIIHFGEQSSSASGLFGNPPGGNQPGTGGIMGSSAQTNVSGSTDSSQSSNPATPVSQMGTLQPGAATLGGGPIVGVATTNKQSSIRVLNKKTHYNDWEFVYDPTQDLANQMGATMGQPGQPGQPSQPIGQSPTSPTGPGTGMFGSQPTPGPAPTQSPSPNPAPAPTTQQ